jgi:hypothetical protein
MRRISGFSAATILAALALAVPVQLAYAGKGNPGGTGPPGQSCQTIIEEGGHVPGHSESSPGSPFNEPGFGTPEGGTGGQNYSESSQYDVACYHVSQH